MAIIFKTGTPHHLKNSSVKFTHNSGGRSIRAWMIWLGCSALIVSPCRAGSIDTLSSWTGATIHTFGDVAGQNPGGTTFGQTFRIHGTDAVLQSLSFVVEGYAPYSAPEA